MKHWIIVLSLTYLTASCTNAVNYQHSERFGVATIETHATDPEQPLQGSIGLKTRTIIVAPGLKNTMANTRTPGGLGESTSVISDFNLTREQTNWYTSTTTVHSAFITGAAAVAAPNSSATAVSGLGVGDLSRGTVEQLELVTSLWENLDTLAMGGDEQAKRYQETLNALAKSFLASDLIKDIKAASFFKGTSTPLQTFQISVNDTVSGSSFLAAMELTDNLRSAQARNQNIQTVVSLDAATRKQVMEDEAEIKQFLQRLHDQFGSNYLINGFATYVVSRL